MHLSERQLNEFSIAIVGDIKTYIASHKKDYRRFLAGEGVNKQEKQKENIITNNNKCGEFPHRKVEIMSQKGLTQFLEFAFPKYAIGKRFVFVKADSWIEKDDDGKIIKELGSKVTTQIVDDKTEYTRNDINNFGAQLVIKVRNQPPSAFQKLKPLVTEVTIEDVEHASVWGTYRNELSIIANIKVKGAE
jgi:hypothetical protein